MSFTNLTEALAKLDELEATAAAYGHAMGVLSVDGTTAAPAASAPNRSKTMAVLSGVIYNLAASPESRALVDYLTEHQDELDDVRRRQVEIRKKGMDQLLRIPQNEYIEYNVLVNEADSVWRKAKQNNDFASFAPTLEKLVAFNRKFAGYYNPDLSPYDALLNEYEEGMTAETLDAFFGQLRSAIVPLVHAIGQKENVDDSFLHQSFPVDTQRRLAKYLMDAIGIDPERCTLAETEHPFTAGFNNQDVRITTHYYEGHVTFAMYSTIHEGGHALYELGVDDRWNGTCLGGGASMGIHESQSRFYENLVGRSRAFMERIFPKLQELFPDQFAGVTPEQMYLAVNKSQPSLIRTEADELTYCLHIMIRYELEKRMICGDLAVADLPAAWNALYKEYLGVDVPSDSVGCLQDTHWAGGMFGYFPSYALGSAYSAQMKHVLESELGPMEDLIAAGEIEKITAWLGKHIHTHGNFKKPAAIFEDACGKFDAKYYTDYLTEKFSKIYGL